jgi:hypothetical protein
MKKTIFCLMIIVHISCSSTKSTSAEKTNEKGFIVGTLTIIDEKPRFNGYGLEYKPEGKEINWLSRYHKIMVHTISRGFKLTFSPDYSIGNKQVYLFVKEHKVGNYEFFNYDLFMNSGYAQSSLKSESEFSIPFSIQSDSINYIGDFIFFPVGNENGNLFEISDKFDRDIPKFKEKFPEKNWDIVQNKTLKEGAISETLIEFK